jgi:hypothetical protein
MCEKGFNVDSIDIPSFEAWADGNLFINQIGMRFGVVPLKNPEIFWFFISNRQIRDNKEEILDKSKIFGNIVNNIIQSTDINFIKKYELNRVTNVKKWYKGRVVLVGDSVQYYLNKIVQMQ